MSEEVNESTSVHAPSEPPAGDAAAIQRELEEARATIAGLEQRQRLEALLRDAGTIDADAARLLAEHEVAAGAAIEAAVEEVRRRRPYLFRPRRSGARVMGVTEDEPASSLDAVAASARDSGSRRDLLAYLRLRRRA